MTKDSRRSGGHFGLPGQHLHSQGVPSTHTSVVGVITALPPCLFMRFDLSLASAG